MIPTFANEFFTGRKHHPVKMIHKMDFLDPTLLESRPSRPTVPVATPTKNPQPALKKRKPPENLVQEQAKAKSPVKVPFSFPLKISTH